MFNPIYLSLGYYWNEMYYAIKERNVNHVHVLL